MTHVRHMSRREALVAAGGCLALALGGCASAADDEAPVGETAPEPVEDPTDLPAEQLDEILDPIRLARGLGQTCRERQE